MKLYICNTPIRFPRSEYGGIAVVMAEDRKRLGRLLTEQYKGSAKEHFDLSHLTVRGSLWSS